MTIEELKRALDGLFAYDTGCVSSGIKDDDLKRRALADLYELERPGVSILIREMWLSEEAIQQGYGAEDLRNFIEWLEKGLGFDFAGA